MSDIRTKGALRAAIQALSLYAIKAEHPDKADDVREGLEALEPFVNASPEIAKWYLEAQLLVLATLSDNLLSGCLPVIADDRVPPGEIWVRGKNGITRRVDFDS